LAIFKWKRNVDNFVDLEEQRASDDVVLVSEVVRKLAGLRKIGDIRIEGGLEPALRVRGHFRWKLCKPRLFETEAGWSARPSPHR
jgi:hypothetical protein